MASFKSSTGASDLAAQLPRQKWWGSSEMYQIEGYWQPEVYLEGSLAFRSNFQALDKDNNGDDCLNTNHPQVLVRTLEREIYKEIPTPNQSPRLFHTHLPYHVLPQSVRNSDSCKIVYVTRNPKDTLTSFWHFMNSKRGPFPMEKAFEDFCDGVSPYGPFFDHVLGYWKESEKSPEKILFIKYEELQEYPKDQVKRLSSFLGRPFGNDEDVDKVLWRCSLERLKNLEVNKKGVSPWGYTNSSFFRLGIVGDWKNNLTPEMSQRLDELTRSKLKGSGLDLIM